MVPKAAPTKVPTKVMRSENGCACCSHADPELSFYPIPSTFGDLQTIHSLHSSRTLLSLDSGNNCLQLKAQSLTHGFPK